MTHANRIEVNAANDTRQSSQQIAADIIANLQPLYKNAMKSGGRHNDTGMSASMRSVMGCLWEQGAQTVPEMARRLGVGRQFIQRVVNDLLEGALVSRFPNPAHQRSWLCDLSARGRDALGRANDREGQMLDVAINGMDHDDLQTCLRVLTQLSMVFGVAAQSTAADKIKASATMQQPLPKEPKFSINDVQPTEKISSPKPVLDWNGGYIRASKTGNAA